MCQAINERGDSFLFDIKIWGRSHFNRIDEHALNFDPAHNSSALEYFLNSS